LDFFFFVSHSRFGACAPAIPISHFVRVPNYAAAPESASD
jgi:hypothetical protein